MITAEKLRDSMPHKLELEYPNVFKQIRNWANIGGYHTEFLASEIPSELAKHLIRVGFKVDYKSGPKVISSVDYTSEGLVVKKEIEYQHNCYVSWGE